MCGISNGRPKAVEIVVDSKNFVQKEWMISHDQTVDFHILSPSDLSEARCNEVFRSNILSIGELPQQAHLIAAATSAIKALAPLSAKINGDVQFWSYDLATHFRIEHILPLPPKVQDRSE